MSRRLPSLNTLRAFEAVARHHSFARAAEELHVTPAAVSQLVKQLEENLGMNLFKRGKVLGLSASAYAALPLISEAFDQLARAVEQLRIDNNSGTLIVSAPPVFAARWLIPRLEDFHTRYPDIELRLLATRRMVDFALEEVDVALRFGAGPYAGLFSERLMTETIVMFASPALAATIKTQADLLQCTLLQHDAYEFDPAFPDWAAWLAAQEVPAIGPLRIRHFGDVNLVIQAATAGLGVAMAWHSLVVDEFQNGRLVPLDTTLPTDHAYHLVTLNHRQSLTKVMAFRAWLQAQASVSHWV